MIFVIDIFSLTPVGGEENIDFQYLTWDLRSILTEVDMFGSLRASIRTYHIT